MSTMTSIKPIIKISTYNATGAVGDNNCLEMASHAITELNIDICVITEPKLATTSHHTTLPSSSEYQVMTTTSFPHSGGVALVFRDKPEQPWHVQDVQTIHANIVSAVLVHGTARWCILGAYIPPGDDPVHYSTELSMLTSWLTQNRHRHCIVLGAFDIDLLTPRTQRDHSFSSLLDRFGLTDLRTHFYQPRRSGPRRQRQFDASNYILTSSRQDFSNFAVKFPRHFPNNYSLLMATIPTKNLPRLANNYATRRPKFSFSSSPSSTWRRAPIRPNQRTIPNLPRDIPPSDQPKSATSPTESDHVGSFSNGTKE